MFIHTSAFLAQAWSFGCLLRVGSLAGILFRCLLQDLLIRGPWLKHSSPVWLGIVPLLLFCLLVAWIHKTSGAFCSVLFSGEMISPAYVVCQGSLPGIVPQRKIEGAIWLGEPALFFASCLHYHRKWIKSWLLLSVWLLVLNDHLNTWQLDWLLLLLLYNTLSTQLPEWPSQNVNWDL